MPSFTEFAAVNEGRSKAFGKLGVAEQRNPVLRGGCCTCGIMLLSPQAGTAQYEKQ